MQALEGSDAVVDFLDLAIVADQWLQGN